MPNLWHFVVWPEWDGDLPAFMQQVTNTHVKRWKEHRHEIGYGHLYQGRYKRFPVETEDYFYQVVRYVERNALRANLGERAESWRWSSLRRCGARRPSVSHPLDVAFATPHRLAANCQPTFSFPFVPGTFFASSLPASGQIE
jgi:putative transposase